MSVPPTAAVLSSTDEEELRYSISSVKITRVSFTKEPTYTVVSTKSDGSTQEVFRAFSTFVELEDQISALKLESSVSLPKIPLPGYFRSLTPDELEVGRALLEAYLKRLIKIPTVNEFMFFRSFLKPTDREDWPSLVGPIDLNKHDLPHASSATEWWYYNCHFTAGGNTYSAFVCFFRKLKHTDEKTGKKTFAHALNWAVTDVDRSEYVSETILDKDTPEIVKKTLEKGNIIKDKLLRQAYMEVLDKNSVPLPDKMFTRDPICNEKRFHLHFQNAECIKDKNGHYVISAKNEEGTTALSLTFSPSKPPIRHGKDGIVKGHDGDDMFYYFIPRNKVTGTVTVGGKTVKIDRGEGWYDHEFGGVDYGDNTPMDYAWNWAALQLNNNTELSVATLVNPNNMELMETRAVLIDAQGRRTQPTDLKFTGLNTWTSVRTFNTYPTAWRIEIPSVELDITIKAPFDDQEFVTLIAKPAFWEGRVEVAPGSTIAGVPVKGVGYVERNGFSTLSELGKFFKAVGAETRAAVRHVYPDELDRESIINLVATEETERYVEGVPAKELHRNLIEPLRYISDRGGKSWRSYGVLACIDVVGGDARKYVKWLAMPEFMHVGSLIVDDIQDDSEIRRGVPCCHLKYGNAVAINAGTAAYFQGQKMIALPTLSAEELNTIYDLYFAALRGGHAGQALDIYGLGYLMDEVVESGNGELAESRLLAIHRLKTAVPVGCLARMGSIVGKGTKEQVEAVGCYFESIGVAFQIMDDVLNLKGLITSEADLKSGQVLKNLGEDIMAGKVTMPVVKAISRLPKAEMKDLWTTIKSKPTDRAVVDACIQKLDDCGAITACEDQAKEMVESAWIEMDKQVPDSFSKIMLRSFGYFVTERHH